MRNHDTYTANLPFEPKFLFAANLAHASAPIYIVDDDGTFLPTQYRTADCGHSIRDALRCAIVACGEEFYVDPSDPRPSEEQLEELVMRSRIH
jgi:hypothetical protein